MKSFLKCREGKRAVSIRKHVPMSIKTCRGIKKCISGMERYMDLRIRQMEFLQKEGITTREELAAYRKPLEEQVLSLMKERRTLYRKEAGGMRIQEINGELKELRKKIRLSQQIEIQSKEMEERLKRAKEQAQETSGKQRREEERKR